jgi:hypothetical protein
MPCSKVSFPTKEAALKRIKEIHQKKQTQKKPLNSYVCSKCGKIHLTSMTKKSISSMKKRTSGKLVDRMDVEVEYWSKKMGWKELIND